MPRFIQAVLAGSSSRGPPHRLTQESTYETMIQKTKAKGSKMRNSVIQSITASKGASYEEIIEEILG
jgi:hypothetical protein